MKYLFIIICIVSKTVFADCPQKQTLPPNLVLASQFLTDGIYALHLQLLNEDFKSSNSENSRAKIFDSLVDSPFWSEKINDETSFNIFWNWIRFQYWGMTKQQGLLVEEQGFKVSLNRNVRQNFKKINSFPIYPYVQSFNDYNCNTQSKIAYPCNKKIIEFNVILSPTLACENPTDTRHLTFQYLVIEETSGWVILDIHFKGKSLIKDTYIEYDNLINQYGSSEALSQLQKLLGSNELNPPNLNPNQTGIRAFNQKYKIKAPKYPLSY